MNKTRNCNLVSPLLGLILTLLAISVALADDVIDPINKWAWSTNTGWINFAPGGGGVSVYADHLEGYAWSENVGWIRLGTCTGGSPCSHGNTSATDYGVNNDGAGNLSGYAWSTSAGWINFAPANGGVTIDADTGDFDGYAWSENIGWIHFQNANPAYKVTTTWRANDPPVANAGQDQTVDTLALVTLDGSESYDPHGDDLTYFWTQVAGPGVTFTPHLSVTTFTAPDNPAVLTFVLVVTDNLGLASMEDEVVIMTTNQPPVASAGQDQVVDTLVPVTLDGSGSYDLDGDMPLTYMWSQEGGPNVTFTPHLSVTTFTAPVDPAMLTFTLVVTDHLGLGSTRDEVVVTVTNQPPVASAGLDQVVNTLALVTLDGSGSHDPDGDDPLIYLWSQTGGPEVSFTPRVSMTTFTAPVDPAVLTFTLVVTDGLGLVSAEDEVVITVANQPPVASAGSDQVVDTLALVTLDGSESHDPDGDDLLTYLWSQGGGPSVTFTSHLSVTTFTAPANPAVLTFTLVVTDDLGRASLQDEVMVAVMNQRPIAIAGPNQVVNILALVTLDGSGSYDPDDHLPMTYLWTQTGGSHVKLGDPTAVMPSFIAPRDTALLTFTLTVTDSSGLPAMTRDEVVITVEPYRVYLPLAVHR